MKISFKNFYLLIIVHILSEVEIVVFGPIDISNNWSVILHIHFTTGTLAFRIATLLFVNFFWNIFLFKSNNCDLRLLLEILSLTINISTSENIVYKPCRNEPK